MAGSVRRRSWADAVRAVAVQAIHGSGIHRSNSRNEGFYSQSHLHRPSSSFAGRFPGPGLTRVPWPEPSLQTIRVPTLQRPAAPFCIRRTVRPRNVGRAVGVLLGTDMNPIGIRTGCDPGQRSDGVAPSNHWFRLHVHPFRRSIGAPQDCLPRSTVERASIAPGSSSTPTLRNHRFGWCNPKQKPALNNVTR